MKKREIIGFLLILLSILLMTEASAGTGAIPSGPDVKMLKNSIRFKQDNVRIIANDTDSPVSASKTADLGSAYIKKDDGVWYKKADNGASTNWQLFIFGALGLGGIDNFIPRWDGDGSGVLQDSAIYVTDAGEIGVDGFEGSLITSTSDGGDSLAWAINGGGADKDALRGAYINVTGNEYAGAEGSGSISIGLGNELGGTGLRIFDRNGVQALRINKEGSIEAGQAGEIVDLTTDTHADTLHIGSTPVSASAPSILQVESTTLGSIPAPIMTEAQRDAIVGPVAGLQAFVSGSNTDVLQYYDGARWRDIGAGGFEEWQATTDYKLGDVVSAIDPVNNRNQLYRANADLTSAGVNINLANWTEIGEHINAITSGSATDEGILRWDGTTGDLIQDSSITIADDGDITLSGNRVNLTTSTEFIPNTIDGSDNYRTSFFGGGASTLDRGGSIAIGGNETAGLNGGITFTTGDNATGSLLFRGGLTPSTAMEIRANSSINLPLLTATLPLQLDGSNDVISQALDLSNASGSFTGILPVDNGGTGLDGSSAPDGEILIGNGTGFTLAPLLGTLDQINVVSGSGSITLSTPQDIATTSSPSFSGMAIGLASPDASSILHVSSSDSGVLIPNLTTIQKDAIVSPAESLLVYDTDQQKFNYHDGSDWKKIGGSEFFDTAIGPSSSDQVQLPFEQLTVVSSSAPSILRIETGNDSFLTNGSFEHEAFSTGWATSGSGTSTIDLVDVWEGSNAFSYITSGSQSMELSQTKTLTQYEGNTLGFSCMVKSDSAKVKLCTENGTDEKDCVFHDGNGMWKKMQAIMMVDSTGIMKGSIKNVDLDDADVSIDSCEWSNDPLKIKNINEMSEWIASGATSVRAVTTNPTKGTIVTDEVFYKRVGDSMKVRMTFEQSTAGTAGSGQYIFDIPNGEQIDLSKLSDVSALLDMRGTVVGTGRITNTFTPSASTQQFISVIPADSTGVSFLIEDVITFSDSGYVNSGFFAFTNNPLYFTVEFTVPIVGWSANDGNILTASDIVSSETMAFQFKGSGTGPLDCNIDPVGTYTTFSRANGSNAFVQCLAQPTIPPTNLDGIDLAGRSLNETGTCTTGVTRYDICMGKGLRGLKVFGYQSPAKGGDSLDTAYINLTANTLQGLEYSYNETTGVMSINAGRDPAAHISHTFNRVGSTNLAVANGYFHFHASKNPVVNAIETIPIVDYSWENEFSAYIDTDGAGCTISQENKDWLASCGRDSLGIFRMTFVVGYFSQPPNIFATGESTADITVSCITNTTVDAVCEVNGGGVKNDNADFYLKASRQGSDYKERGSTAAIIAQPTCFIKHEEPSGTNGGICSVSYMTRVLNKLEGECSGISINSNVVTVPKGTWKIRASMPTRRTALTKTKWVQDPNGIPSDVIIGSAVDANFANAVQTYSKINGQFSVSTATEEFEVQQRCGSANTNTDLGAASSFGEVEIYTQVELTRIK